jgi:DNA-binding response OmpR family regulator
MPHTVLCIDNDPGLVSLYSMVFADSGYHVLLACDGHYGLYLLHRNVVHVVVLDYGSHAPPDDAGGAGSLA